MWYRCFSHLFQCYSMVTIWSTTKKS
uniref:Uncharacterized protein n=1 Tax=Anguilla anguilla TaxID=7936 RepID=A0A0E9VZ68_ANGAN